MKQVWAILDDKTGHQNQVLGVVDALGLPCEVKQIAYDDKAALPNIIRGKSLKGVDLEKSDKMREPWPDVVIAAGRRTAPIARYIKKQSGGKTLHVQLMWPGLPVNGIDLIALPEHDWVMWWPFTTNRHLLRTIGAPHRTTKDTLEQQKMMWAKSLEHLPTPRLSVMIGGNTGRTEMSAIHARELGSWLRDIARDTKAALLVSTSRRTPRQVIQVLKEHVADTPHYFHDWQEDTRKNPYYAFLAMADATIVTGDSISMCSEAAAAGCPVYIFAPEGLAPDKHKRLHQSLYDAGYAAPLDDAYGEELRAHLLSPKPHRADPLNSAKMIALEIKRRI